MAQKAFNAVSGYSVGIGELVNVIDSGGNVTAQKLTVNVQANLGSIGNLAITGGQSGQFLQTDGSGNLSFANAAASAGGSNTQVQFNDSTLFGGSANLTFDKTTSLLTIKNVINIGGADSNISGANNISANYFLGNGSLLSGIAVGNSTAIVNGTSNVVVDASSNVRVSIGGTSNTAVFSPAGLTLTGALAAVEKSFVIKHPTKPNMKLRYGSLESPYHGIRLTGEAVIVKGQAVINLPEYVSTLVSEEGVNIQLTNIQHDKVLYVKEIDLKNNLFIISGPKSLLGKTYKFYWSFTAIRKDIPPLLTEYPEE